jgi:hypothetical protein
MIWSRGPVALVVAVAMLCQGVANGSSPEKSGEEKEKAWFEGSVLTRYTLDSLLESNVGRDGDGKKKSLPEIYMDGSFQLGGGFLIHTNMGLRPLMERENSGSEGYLPRKHYFFGRLGLVAEEIDLEYREERLLFGVGKFNPSFSCALKNSYYGIGGTNIVDNYQPLEKLGFYVTMILPMLRARVNFFRNDVTFLSHSLFTDRRGYDLKGDMGNVQDIFENFSLTAEFPTSDNYRVNLGFRKLATTDPKRKSEFGYLFGLGCTIEETRDSIGAAPLLEVVLLHNRGGELKADSLYAVVNLPFFYDNWNFGFSWSARKELSSWDGDSQMIIQSSISYLFRNGLAVDFSRKYEDENYRDSEGKNRINKFSSWGARLSYTLKFD